jgi:surfeit locus 1 family protein
MSVGGPYAGSAQRGSVLWLTVATAVGIAILLGLGVWQLQRRDWKLGLVARIEARVTAPPVALADVVARNTSTGDIEYTRVSVTGTYLPGLERWLYAPSEQGPGFDLFAPLVTPDRKLVLINRGFLPDDAATGTRLPPKTPTGKVTVTGLVRTEGPRSWFALPPDLARAEYYWPDYRGMAASLPTDRVAGLDVLPFAVDAHAEVGREGVWPRLGTTNLVIPNRHLEYALTWFGLAATLLGVYLTVLASRRDRAPAV